MPNCRDCGDFVVFLRKPGGGYMRPVVPVRLDDEGERLLIADAEGVGRPPPQLFRMHVCLSPDEKAAKQRERVEEKQRLIEADRERRRVERETQEALEAERERLAAEQAEMEAIRQAQREEEEREREERRLKKAYDKDAEIETRNFPQHLLTVACRDCGQDPGVACWQLTEDGRLYDPTRAGREYNYRVERGWFTRQAHSARYQDGPPNPVRPTKTPRWGDDYRGPWPPARDDPGRYDMRAWLTENHRIFDTDERPNPDWMWRLTVRERTQMGRFVRTSASILWGDSEEVTDGTGGVHQGSADRRPEGVLLDGRADRGSGDAQQVEGPDREARADRSGGSLDGQRVDANHGGDRP